TMSAPGARAGFWIFGVFGRALLSLDPFNVYAALARLAPLLEELAAEAALQAGAAPEDLSAAGAPLLDIGAERHATWEARLFAS
ncbi:MAG: hypothetical protein L0H73_17220, partial [Nitrococcus sp.]|nr:hypothetical protein [Nitrococcus sp.]